MNTINAIPYCSEHSTGVQLYNRQGISSGEQYRREQEAEQDKEQRTITDGKGKPLTREQLEQVLFDLEGFIRTIYNPIYASHLSDKDTVVLNTIIHDIIGLTVGDNPCFVPRTDGYADIYRKVKGGIYNE